ncbi:MAG: glutathione S-transferase [Pusillimonas sp.]|nr:glutathione S-transferase [Pusillimonas sp.]MBC43170.1 glutathione S-transferase [Pusillimonas sp.]HCP76897.1 glutathione S-transferase [Pusillimonas sp.]
MTDFLPILYSFRRCPYAMRARLAVAASGISCQLREVVLRNKPQPMLDASPKGTVPVLVLPDNEVVDESLDIMLWALRQKDPGQWLNPECENAETMMALIASCDQVFKYHLDRYKYPQRYEDTESAPHGQAGVAWLTQLEARLSASRYLFGERPCLADTAIMPFVRQFARADLDWFNDQPLMRVNAWLNAWLESPLFMQIMSKYKPWEEGDPPVVFPTLS